MEIARTSLGQKLEIPPQNALQATYGNNEN